MPIGFKFHNVRQASEIDRSYQVDLIDFEVQPRIPPGRSDEPYGTKNYYF